MHSSRGTKTPRKRASIRGVECNRIQKLLSSEYSDFSEDILVESPFAETTRNGRGVRQVSLGLTPSILIVAADILKSNSQFFCPRGLDPSIESFELVSVYPLQYVALSVFSRRHRKTLKASLTDIDAFRFADGRASYYELGGIQRRQVSWKKWCEQVESLLARRVDGSSLSETTAASSSSSTTLYILSSEVEVRRETKKEGKKAVCRVWAHYRGAGDYAPSTWTQKDLYLGPGHDELVYGRYAPVPVRFAGASLEDVQEELRDLSPSKLEKPSCSWPTCQCFDKKSQYKGGLCDVLFLRDHNRRYCNTNKFSATCQSCPCNHFGGKTLPDDKVPEKRSVWYNDQALEETATKNRAPRQDARSPRKCLARRISRFGFGVPEKCHSGLVLGPTRRHRDCYHFEYDANYTQNFRVLMENAVKVWEGEGKARSKSTRGSKHWRRYGLCAAPHFLHALGPWSVQPGERSSVQGRRSFSLVTIRRQPPDPELRLPVSRRQLTASISYAALQSGRFGSIGSTARGRVVLFWTPEYWYRPRPAAAAYRELRRHLNHLRNYRQEKDRPMKRKLFYKRRRCQCEEDSLIVAEEKPSFLGRIFSGSASVKKRRKLEDQEENSSTVQLRRLLRMDFRITIWDMESTTLAKQLTVIDRDLFVRIPTEEIEILVFQRGSKNAPNLAAWIAFSHRISCLTVSEVLAVKKLDIRGRIIARLINAASKCFAMGNFHSCRSILSGLQAPPIYRLRRSWSYLRTHHANRYETMERLCKLYKSPCSLTYQRAWSKAEGSPPCLPYVGDLFARLLGLGNTDCPQDCYPLCPIKEAVPQQPLNNVESISLSNKDAPCVNSDENLEAKQGLGRRILASVFNRVKYKKDETTICEEKTDPPWTSREQDLAWKYFYRWNNVVLKRKALVKQEERFRDVDPRLRRVLEVASWLTDCQRRAQGYDIPGHSFTREFLLKTRYREDRENFFISLKLEPSKIT
ncbi:uncharacterized protein LOC143373187 [Andrena cerasifolii]|uniref:uncharacterized protein LOC143373187 n=1 Tax=Andrena cerasifolii TaxID=2819439 RepID=UPI004037CEA1